MSKMNFISSPRFWAIVIGALSIYAQSKGWIGEPEMMLIATITAGFTVVRTVDRVSDKTVEASELAGKTTTISMPEGVSNVAATTDGATIDK